MAVQSPKINAVVFDCFGVLATDGWLPFKNKYFRADPVLFAKATKLNKQVDAGLDNYDNFIREIAKMSGLSINETLVKIEDNAPNLELFRYINEYLKPKYKLGILSNAASNWLNEIFTMEQNQTFDTVVLSFEIGALKPNPITYQTIAQRLGVETSECVFIDDQERYCVAAREVGMRAIRYDNTQKLKRDLNDLLGLS